MRVRVRVSAGAVAHRAGAASGQRPGGHARELELGPAAAAAHLPAAALDLPAAATGADGDHRAACTW
eukprot:scaffold118241_cov21-Phaeocystis_antarctica.AAC.1